MESQSTMNLFESMNNEVGLANAQPRPSTMATSWGDRLLRILLNCQFIGAV